MHTHIYVSEVKQVGAQRGEHRHGLGSRSFISEFCFQSMGLKSSIPGGLAGAMGGRWKKLEAG